MVDVRKRELHALLIDRSGALHVIFVGGGHGCEVLDHVDVSRQSPPTITVYIGNAPGIGTCALVGIMQQVIVADLNLSAGAAAIDGATGQRLTVRHGEG